MTARSGLPSIFVEMSVPDFQEEHRESLQGRGVICQEEANGICEVWRFLVLKTNFENANPFEPDLPAMPALGSVGPAARQ